ncbi:PREDICTED: uncharacterized protein LOC109472943 [Branchiostoma belcheri]|uniref:Uncharacterized protein LOC109472943 n=1 Tax=Branchiostoma belcheri TaxID=7741 RepID=A0A6P4YVJ7_BRABE|nr:PREDICTED: uncharacterized protein LOC109472943 [Branchiostoma belcheri]
MDKPGSTYGSGSSFGASTLSSDSSNDSWDACTAVISFRSRQDKRIFIEPRLASARKMTGGMIPGKIMSKVQALATPDSIATLDKLGMLNKLGPLASVLIGMSGLNKGGKKGGKKGGGFLKGLGSKDKGNNIDLGALQSLGSMLGGGSKMAAMAGMAGMVGSKMPPLGGGGRGGFDPTDGLDMQDARALAGMASRSGNAPRGPPQGHRFDPSDGLDLDDARGAYDMYRGQSAGYRGQPDPRVIRGAPSGYEGRGGPRLDMGDGMDIEDMQAVAGRVGGRY